MSHCSGYLIEKIERFWSSFRNRKDAVNDVWTNAETDSTHVSTFIESFLNVCSMFCR